MIALAILMFLALTALAVLLAVPLLGSLFKDQAVSLRVLSAIVMVGLSVFLMRPHEDTFIGLDTSAYRNMVRAFDAGRGFHDTDEGVLDIPESSRKWTLLAPDGSLRPTRDRSFEVRIGSGSTMPFFYPVLPLAMWGMSLLTPGDTGDYFVPLLGSLFMVSLIAVAVRRARVWGLAISLALLAGVPILAWQFRGAHVEAVSAVFFGLVALRCADRETMPSGILDGLGIGCAILLHPVMLLPASIIVFGSVIKPDMSLRSLLALLAGIATGIAGLIVLTLMVCEPYGGLAWADTVARLRHSATHRLAAGSLAILAIAGIVAYICRRPISGILARRGSGVMGRLLLVMLWILPTVLTTNGVLGGDSRWVSRGLYDVYTGFQPWMSLVFLAGGALVLKELKPHAIWIMTAVMVTFPMFLYLKGAEPMGYWSLRRIVVPYALAIAVFTPMLAGAIAAGHVPKGLRAGLCLGILICGLINPIRWPDPYLVRNEKGAETFVETFKSETGGAVLFFESFNDSLPFSCEVDKAAYGLSDQNLKGLESLAPAVRDRAAEEKVFWVSTFDNPGMESGVILRPVKTLTQNLTRIRAKWIFPVVTDQLTRELNLLEAVIPTEGETPTLDKTFDGGWLGLRGQWGRSARFPDAEGQMISGMWSRQKSAVVGPYPEAGRVVTIQMTAASGVPGRGQTILITPPWGGDGAPMAFDDQKGEVSVSLKVPDDAQPDAVTGLYRISSPTPYDPASDNIKGYRRDLGAIIHRVIIQEVPSS